MFVSQDAHARRQHLVAADELGDRIAVPADGAVVRQDKGIVARRVQLFRACVDFAAECLGGGRAQCPSGLAVAGRRIRRETEAVQPPDMLAFDGHVSGPGDLGLKHCVFP